MSTAYNYLENTKNNVYVLLSEEINKGNINLEKYSGNREGLIYEFMNLYRCENSITGINQEGYTDKQTAEEYLSHNFSTLANVLEMTFYGADNSGKKIIECLKNPQLCDSMIRSHFLAEATDLALSQYEKEHDIDLSVKPKNEIPASDYELIRSAILSGEYCEKSTNYHLWNETISGTFDIGEHKVSFTVQLIYDDENQMSFGFESIKLPADIISYERFAEIGGVINDKPLEQLYHDSKDDTVNFMTDDKHQIYFDTYNVNSFIKENKTEDGFKSALSEYISNQYANNHIITNTLSKLFAKEGEQTVKDYIDEMQEEAEYENI